MSEVLASIYASGEPIVKQAYSDYDAPTKTFPSLQSLQDDIACVPEQKRKFFHYAIYYPAARGFVLEKRIELKPGAVKNHTHRFSQEGWGLIFLQITFKDAGNVECCVLANSETRANNWSVTLARLGAPDRWDWVVVKHHAGRLIRFVRKLAKQQAEQGADGKTPEAAQPPH